MFTLTICTHTLNQIKDMSLILTGACLCWATETKKGSSQFETDFGANRQAGAPSEQTSQKGHREEPMGETPPVTGTCYKWCVLIRTLSVISTGLCAV